MELLGKKKADRFPNTHVCSHKQVCKLIHSQLAISGPPARTSCFDKVNGLLVVFKRLALPARWETVDVEVNDVRGRTEMYRVVFSNMLTVFLLAFSDWD